MNRGMLARRAIAVGVAGLVIWTAMLALPLRALTAPLSGVTVEGVVADSMGHKIPWAYVSADVATVRADAYGHYILHVPTTDTVSVAAWAPNYQRMPYYTHLPGLIGAGSTVYVNFTGPFALQSAHFNPTARAHLFGLPVVVRASRRAVTVFGTSALPLAPNVAVTQPSGAVRFFALQTRGIHFHARIRFTANGMYWVEANAASGVAVFTDLVFHGVRPFPPADPKFPPDPAPATRVRLQQFALMLINHERAALGQRPLAFQPTVERVAIQQNADMLQFGSFSSHSRVGATGSTVEQRIVQAGFPAQAASQDFGEGPTVGRVITGFLESPSHRATLLGDYRWAGIAVTPTGGQLLMTVDLAR